MEHKLKTTYRILIWTIMDYNELTLKDKLLYFDLHYYEIVSSERNKIFKFIHLVLSHNCKNTYN